MSPFDIIARLERNPTGWVCIRREAADEIRKLRGEVSRLTDELDHFRDPAMRGSQRYWEERFRDEEKRADELSVKFSAAVNVLEHYAALDGLLAPAEAKSCHTCGRVVDGSCGIEEFCTRFDRWQPKPTKADVCPTCEGVVLGVGVCPNCGTGKKEKSDGKVY